MDSEPKSAFPDLNCFCWVFRHRNEKGTETDATASDPNRNPENYTGLSPLLTSLRTSVTYAPEGYKTKRHSEGILNSTSMSMFWLSLNSFSPS